MAKKMQIKKGIAVSPGYKVRKVFLLEDEDYFINRRFLSDNDAREPEVARFRAGVEATRVEIESFKKETLEYMSDETLQIFSAHLAFLYDPQLHKAVEKKILHNKFTAEYAVVRTMKAIIKNFKMKAKANEFWASRASDLIDIEKRLVRNLLGKQPASPKGLSEEVIVVAKDLTPSQTASFDRRYVVGFATDSGGKTSHTAIVARAFGIPAVVGLEAITDQVRGEDTVVIDGVRGLVIINPDKETLEKYERMEREYDAYGQQLTTELKDLPSETRDGYEIGLWANIEVPEDIQLALKNGASGVGLYRTEFLYAQNREVPTEETHYNAYRKAIEELKGRPIVIRLLDLGADKFYNRTDNINEKNPFLGCRSIRYLFQKFDILKDQLRAILRASSLGEVKILLPMISTVSEVRKAKSILEDTKEELAQRNIQFDRNIKLGVMLEVPSAVLICDILCQEVDFFSIGTNDLVQYTLAVDRINERVAPLYQPLHPAIIRMLKKVIETGKKNNIPVSICGEMSGEVKYVIPLIGLGLTNISLTPKMIPEIKKVIRSTTLKEAKEIAEAIFAFADAEETEKYVSNRISKMVPELFPTIQ